MHSFAMRPEAESGSVMLARLSETIHQHPAGDMAAITAASAIVHDIMLEAGNATEHLSAGAEETLKNVMEMVKTSMYGSMDDAHRDDKSSLDDAIEKIKECNADIVALQSSTGLLGKLQQAAKEAQYELNRLNDIVVEKTEINRTKWEAFELHMELIQTPPACPSLPARTMPTLDAFFSKSLYSLWFAAQQPLYFKVKAEWVAAHEALLEAIAAYNIQKAKLDVHYCDWKRELEAACARFDTCWSTRSHYYSNELIPRVESSMQNRVEVYKAGETLIVQIEFLLALRDSSETGDVDASKYNIDFEGLPQKEVCDLSPLTSSIWNPPITCESTGAAWAWAPAATNACPDGFSKFETELACRSALASEPWARFQDGFHLDNVPGGCFKIDRGDKSDIYFNSHAGTGAEDRTLVCRPLATRTVRCGGMCANNDNKPWHGNNGRNKCNWNRCIDCQECV